jgi:hypothetical protein
LQALNCQLKDDTKDLRQKKDLVMSRQQLENFSKNHLVCIMLWLAIALILTCSVLGFGWASQREETVSEKDFKADTYSISVTMENQTAKTETFTVPVSLSADGQMQCAITVNNTGANMIVVKLQAGSEANTPYGYSFLRSGSTDTDNPAYYLQEANTTVEYVLNICRQQEESLLEQYAYEQGYITITVTCSQASDV